MYWDDEASALGCRRRRWPFFRLGPSVLSRSSAGSFSGRRFLSCIGPSAMFDWLNLAKNVNLVPARRVANWNARTIYVLFICKYIIYEHVAWPMPLHNCAHIRISVNLRNASKKSITFTIIDSKGGGTLFLHTGCTCRVGAAPKSAGSSAPYSRNQQENRI